MIKKKLIVDDNLLYLQKILLDLKAYRFDKDISKLLNDLRNLVDSKLYSNLDLEDFEVLSVEHVIKCYLKQYDGDD